MQLHNLVLISIQKNNLDFIGDINHQIYSPIKNKHLNSNVKDQILWKKSNSAFKKFKGKKIDKINHVKARNVKYSFQRITITFYHHKKNAKQNYLAMINQQTFKVELEYQYYDPNIAPFFQYNSQDLHNVKVNEPFSVELKRQQSINQKNDNCNKNSKQIVQKQIQKQKQIINLNLQVYQKDIIVNKNQNKNQNKKYNKSNLSNQQYQIHKNITQTDTDPFIIIKSVYKKLDILNNYVLKIEQQIKQDNRKTKRIKKVKNPYVKVGSYVYSTSYVPYLSKNPNCQKIQQSHSVQNENLNNQDDLEINLPFIEFDLCMHMPSQISHHIQNQNQIICIKDQEPQINNINRSIQTNLTQVSQDSKFNCIKQGQINHITKFQYQK